MAGGAHRGPPALRRQKRTVRIVQVILLGMAAGLLLWAGYSLGRVAGFDDGRRADALERPRPPSPAETIVLAALGGAALAGAFALGGGGVARVPTPARLDELSGRAEAAAIDRAQRVQAAVDGGASEA
jgi:hypothetical protein